MNNVFYLGRITKQPEVRQTNGGKEYCRFTLARVANSSHDSYSESLALHKAKIYLSSARLVSKSEKAGENSSYFAKNAEL
jgi:single-stranded DNA-binding protein